MKVSSTAVACIQRTLAVTDGIPPASRGTGRGNDFFKKKKKQNSNSIHWEMFKNQLLNYFDVIQVTF